MTDFINFLYTYYPNTEWSIKIENYDGLLWGENNKINKPTKEEFENNFATFINSKPLRLLRIQRNRLLQETDWMALNDVVVSEEWKAYRQALRDLPANSEPQLDENGNLTNVTWPTKPGENT
jgi:hypothetical protein